MKILHVSMSELPGVDIAARVPWVGSIALGWLDRIGGSRLTCHHPPALHLHFAYLHVRLPIAYLHVLLHA
jgi:hypothetical protein